jgi:NADH-quinone oxidoreductase subunit J
MVLTHRERPERRNTQRELAEQRVRDGVQAHPSPGHHPSTAGSAWPLVTPAPAPGTFARNNAVDIPALLPDGTPAEVSVNPTLRARGQYRDVSRESTARVAELDRRTRLWQGRELPPRPAAATLQAPPPPAGATEAGAAPEPGDAAALPEHPEDDAQ